MSTPGTRAYNYQTLGRLECVARSIPIPATVTPWQVLQALGDTSDVVFLVGEWADDSVLIATDPIFRAEPGSDPAEVFAAQPTIVEADERLVCGGWFGLLGYDPAANCLAFYDHLLRWDDRDGWRLEMLWSHPRSRELAEVELRWVNLLDSLSAAVVAQGCVEPGRVELGRVEPAKGWELGTFLPVPTSDVRVARDRHLSAVEHAISRIRQGEIYQVNVCTWFSAIFAGDSVQMFTDAVASLGPARGAYLRGTEQRGCRREILSFSPELFLQRRGNRVQTRPIKGTRARGGGDAGVDFGASALAHSAKDVAENVMIVDLMRNDLARVCRPGSVQTPDLLRVEPHAGVWHLISTVTGVLREDCGDRDLIASCFPPGSVTGAPKISAIEAIAEIEPLNRDAYTGAIGFASPCWGLELNVVIRTLQIADGVASIGVGGGVTTDSVPQLEWQECLDKLAPVVQACGGVVAAELLDGESETRSAEPIYPEPEPEPESLLETMLAVDRHVLRLADHLGRLARSAAELWGSALPVDIADRVNAVASQRSGRRVIRIVATFADDADGARLIIDVTNNAVPQLPASTGARIVRRSRRSWRHKWADRSELAVIEDEVRSVHPGDSPLFLDQSGSLAEFSRGNLFLYTGLALVTPPLTDDVLPGVTRQAVLDAAKDLGLSIEIAPIIANDLRSRDVSVFWTSAISGIVAVHSLNGVLLDRYAEGAAIEEQLRGKLGFI